MRGRAFDVYVVVDWSASSTPKLGPDSIWVHVRDATDTVAADPVNLPTRASAFGYLRDTLCAAAGRRVLVGLDMPYGYPSGFAAAAGIWWLARTHRDTSPGRGDRRRKVPGGAAHIELQED